MGGVTGREKRVATFRICRILSALGIKAHEVQGRWSESELQNQDFRIVRPRAGVFA